MERARRFSVREIMSRVKSEWTGSELELEIRSALPGKFLRAARKGGSRAPETARLWVGLEDFLNSLEPGRV